jgi:hypothetical protein
LVIKVFDKPNTPFSLGQIFVVFRNLLRNALSIIYEWSKIMHSRQQQLIKSQQDQDMHHIVSHGQQNTQHVLQQFDHATDYEW